jgi:hypothetical protein
MAKNLKEPNQVPVLPPPMPTGEPLSEITIDPNVPEAQSLEQQIAEQNSASGMSQTLDVDPDINAPGLPTFQGLPNLDRDMPAPVLRPGQTQIPGMSPAYYQEGGFIATFSGDYLAKQDSGKGVLTKPIPRQKAIVLNKRETLKELKRVVIPQRYRSVDRQFIRARLIIVDSVEPLPGTQDLVLGKKLSDIRLMNFKELGQLIREQNLDIKPEIYGDDILALRQAVDDQLNANPLQKGRKTKKEVDMLYNRKVIEQNKKYANLLKI